MRARCTIPDPRNSASCAALQYTYSSSSARWAAWASSAPLDQFVVRNPSYFFDASPERALIDPDNLHILVDHVKCAAFELPFAASEAFGRHDVQEVLHVLAEQGLVHQPGEGAPWTWTMA